MFCIMLTSTVLSISRSIFLCKGSQNVEVCGGPLHTTSHPTMRKRQFTQVPKKVTKKQHLCLDRFPTGCISSSAVISAGGGQWPSKSYLTLEASHVSKVDLSQTI